MNVKFNDTTTDLNRNTAVNQSSLVKQGTSVNQNLVANQNAYLNQGVPNSQYTQGYNQNINFQYGLGPKQQGFQTTYTPGFESNYGTRPI